jgi:hypothetical protein
MRVVVEKVVLGKGGFKGVGVVWADDLGKELW